MSETGSNRRYHDLDALRAVAMLMGVVLHAGWIMAPMHWGAIVHDVDGSYELSWLVWWIHMFRLQTFYLIAGFFGNMVFCRRGQSSFIKHRLSRIGIPLLIGWVILYPIMASHNVWAGVVRGRILTNNSFWSLFLTQVRTSFHEVLPTFHLWFLYDLLLLYFATLLFRFVFIHLLDRKGVLSGMLIRGYRWLLNSPSNLVLLAIPSAILLLPMKFWVGLEAFPVWLVPPWAGFMGYWLFFAIGWILYSQVDLLPTFDRRWKLNLGAGTALSVALFIFYCGFLYPHVTPTYPAVDTSDIRYSAYRTSMLTARDRRARSTCWHRRAVDATGDCRFAV